MLEGRSAKLKPEKRQEMEERVNILTTFIRSMLNDRDAWKKHDAVSNGPLCCNHGVSSNIGLWWLSRVTELGEKEGIRGNA